MSETAQTLKILHVDDQPEADAVQKLRDSLTRSKCEVDTAEDISRASERLNMGIYDYVVLDLVKGRNVAAMEFKEVIDYAQATKRPPKMLVLSAFLGNCDRRLRKRLDEECIGVFTKDEWREAAELILRTQMDSGRHQQPANAESNRLDSTREVNPPLPEAREAVRLWNWRREFWRLWMQVDRKDLERRAALAVVQGIIERSCQLSLWRAEDWLHSVFEHISGGSSLAAETIESEARQQNCGLQVFDAERDPDQITAYFGVVQAITDGVADVSMYIRETTQQSDAPVMEAIKIPEIDLPVKYCQPGVWVAWVERTYGDGPNSPSKGRFEPGGALPESGEQVSEKFEAHWNTSPRLRCNYG